MDSTRCRAEPGFLNRASELNAYKKALPPLYRLSWNISEGHLRRHHDAPDNVELLPGGVI